MTPFELIDARETLELLNIGERELVAQVARGNLRAYRSGGEMKFRREDVLALQREAFTKEPAILPAKENSGAKKSGILNTALAQDPNKTGEIMFNGEWVGGTFFPANDIMDDAQATSLSTGVATAVEPAVQPAAEADFTHLQKGEVVTKDAAPAPIVAVSRPSISQSRVKLANARRTAAVFEVKTRHPFATAALVLHACVFVFTASIFTVYAFKGHYDADSGNRVIPPYLSSVYQHNFHGSWFTNLPGTPRDGRVN